jgi:glutamine amidotransferase
MFKRAGFASAITSKTEDILSASKLVLPGMGHFDNCMVRLNESGLRPAIEKKVFADKIPILGICVGLQMLMGESEEGSEPGLGWLEGKTIRFDFSSVTHAQKIPNMGWQNIEFRKPSGLTNDLEDPRFYFAHSFHVAPQNNTDILATGFYGYDYPVALEKDNIIGVQFHPEKSHRFGMQLLKNFVEQY